MSKEELHERLERGREIWRANQVEIKELHGEVARLRGACAEKDKQIEGLEQLAGSQQTGNAIHFRLAFGSASRRIHGCANYRRDEGQAEAVSYRS